MPHYIRNLALHIHPLHRPGRDLRTAMTPMALHNNPQEYTPSHSFPSQDSCSPSSLSASCRNLTLIKHPSHSLQLACRLHRSLVYNCTSRTLRPSLKIPDRSRSIHSMLCNSCLALWLQTVFVIYAFLCCSTSVLVNVQIEHPQPLLANTRGTHNARSIVTSQLPAAPQECLTWRFNSLHPL